MKSRKERKGKNLSVRQTGCMKEGSRTREGEREEEAVKIKKPAPLRGFPPRRMLSSFLPSLTHSRGKNGVYYVSYNRKAQSFPDQSSNEHTLK